LECDDLSSLSLSATWDPLVKWLEGGNDVGVDSSSRDRQSGCPALSAAAGE
jgi:hypothetical protein